MVELEAPHHAGTKVFDQHIGGSDEAADGLDAVRRFQIEHDAVLADVERTKRGAAAVANGQPRPH